MSVTAVCAAHLVLAPADVAWKSGCPPQRRPATRAGSPTHRGHHAAGALYPVNCHASPRSRRTRRATPTAGKRASGVGGRRDAEHAAAARSRKARAAIRRGDFMPCDPRRSQRLARRIGAPDMCRPPTSLVAARAPGYEPRAISRRAERRRPPTPLVRCSSAGPTKQ